ncbi:MAG: CrcB family protein [Acidimicrobiia bacterium]
MVLIGGAAGSLTRASVTSNVASVRGWPLGTLAVNLAGSLLLGWLLARLERSALPLTYTVPLLAIGLLGAFTTFSTFALEVWTSAVTDHWLLAVGYTTVSIGLGMACAVAGARIGEAR